MKVIIVGGVAGGASAAARIRRLDEKAEIIVFERSGYVSYANCGLPYYVGGVITNKAALTLQTPESFHSRFRIDIRVRHEVTAIDAANRTVSVTNLETGESFTESYDKLNFSKKIFLTILWDEYGFALEHSKIVNTSCLRLCTS